MISSITNSGLVSAHATIRNIDTLALKTHDRSLIRKISFIDTKRNSIYLGAPRSHGKSVCRGNYTYHFGFNGGFKRLYRINNLNGFLTSFYFVIYMKLMLTKPNQRKFEHKKKEVETLL
jgi:hypothetical protein